MDRSLLRRCAVCFVIVIVGAISAALSCKTFNLPDEICDPRGLRTPIPAGQGTGTDSTCTRCLEENCCDDVGVCERSNGCADMVSRAHRCVIEAGLQGAAAESECASDSGLAPETPQNTAYRCMRGKCGTQCGLPVCRLDTAAILLQGNPDCDRCFAGACCSQLNACYASRACKLIVECVDGCNGFRASGGSGPGGPPLDGNGPPDGADDDDADFLCRDGGTELADLGGCVAGCLCKFRNNDPGLPPEDKEMRPFALARRFFECGSSAGCLEICGKADAGARPTDAAAE